MPTLELIEDENPFLLSKPKPQFDNLSAEEQAAFLDKVAAEVSNDPAALNRLASTFLKQATKDDFNNVTVQPIPGYVCRTSTVASNNEKHKVGTTVYINICHAAAIPEPTLATEAEIQKALNAEPDAKYRVPLSMGEPRFEKTTADKVCLIMDACIHTQPYLRSERDLDFRLYIMELAMEYVEENEHISLSREFTMPKMSSKGTIPKRIVRLPKPSLMTAVRQSTDAASTQWKCTPTVSVQGKHILVVVPMPNLNSSDWRLDMETKQLIISVNGVASHIPLPRDIDINAAENTAQFYKKSRDLVVCLSIQNGSANAGSETRRQYL
ncbi:pre-RNA processing PIH1/Nop17-domain-containing protein [Radiomyces spectabilis]|uniref:pre-RNA processing PIH1/Nop17-domain-containing protein n=1 Tax=Radiomyces spectabilis TaxID=64574 RepID=UPI00221F6705|nr:pre-RNA processing PIH1/Nop17-domain-containing protein [Radiomyces spectabilis]KAI8393759.1 pre-RNA processing PIH1/Nop17-domain-containing protein [Radiomyces spectabilis]